MAVMASAHREECWTRLRLVMVTATMNIKPQNRLDVTHSSAAGISVCQCGKCAEATLDVKTVLMLRSVMRISLVSHGGGYRREANFRLFWVSLNDKSQVWTGLLSFCSRQNLLKYSNLLRETFSNLIQSINSKFRVWGPLLFNVYCLVFFLAEGYNSE